MRSKKGSTASFEKNVIPLEAHKLFFDRLPIGICIITTDHTILDFNRKAQEWFPSLSKGIHTEKIFKSGKIINLITDTFNIKSKDKPYLSEVIELKTKKEEKFLKCTMFTVYGKQDVPSALVISLEDITEKQLVEKWIAEETASIQLKYNDQAKKLIESEKIYRELFENYMPAVITNEKIEIVGSNRSFIEFVSKVSGQNFTKNDFKNIKDFIPLSTFKRFSDNVKKTFKEKKILKDENFRTILGNWLNASFIPFEWHNEKRIMIVIEDITGRKKIEEENAAILNNLKEQIKISTNILFEKNTRKIIEEIVNSISEFTDFQTVLFSLFKQEFPYRDIFVSKNIPADEIEHLSQVPEKAEDYYREISKGKKIKVADFGIAYYFPQSHYKYLSQDRIILSDIKYENGDTWQKTDELFIPILDSKEELIGALSLDDPKSGKAPTKESLIPIVMFARQLSYILEKIKLEEEIRSSEAKYRKLVQSSPDIIYSLNTEGNFTFVNDEVKNLIGYKPDELIGKHFTEIVYNEDLDKAHFRINERRTGERATRGLELRLLTKDKIIRHFDINYAIVEINAAGIYDTDIESTGKKYLGTQGIARDVTERKLFQQQLLQTEKLVSLGEIIAEIIHELNNPLSVIMGYSQILGMYKNLSPKARKNIEKIENEARRSKKIVKNLLDFIRKKELKTKPVIVNDVLKKTIDMREYDFNVSNIKIIRNFESGIPFVNGDPDQLQQVFLNILNNAYDAMYDYTKNGILEIKTYHLNENVFIEFIDNGPGVEKDIEDRIFDPFITTKTDRGGTGLGISLSFRIIKEHKGLIYLDKSYNKGAKFVIRLPDKDAYSKLPGDKPEKRETLNLLIFGEKTGEFKEISSRENFRLEFTTDFNSAKAKILESELDAIIVFTYAIKGYNGTQLHEAIKNEKPGLEAKFIFIIEKDVDEKTYDYINKTLNPVIKKPFKPDEFTDTVNAAVKKKLKNF